MLQVVASSDMGARVVGHLRFKMFHKIQTINLFNQDEQLESDLITRFTNDLSFVESMCIYMMWTGINYIAMGIFGTLLLIYFDWLMALIVAIFMPIALILPRIFSKRAGEKLKEKKQMETNMLTDVQEAITMQDVVRLLLLRGFKRLQFKQKLMEAIKINFHYSLMAGLTGRTSFFGLNFLRLLVLCGGGYLVVLGLLTPGKLIGFIMLLGSVSGAISSMMSLYPILNRSAESLVKIQELIDEKGPAIKSGHQIVPTLKNNIRFDQVDFSYDHNPIVSDINITIEKGKSVAFVGPSGARKSTIIKMILKEIEPTNGTIFLDDQKYQTVSTRSLLSQIGVVMQQPKLFEGSIEENIRLGKLDATKKEIIQAAKIAGVHEDIMQFPLKYDTLIGKRNTGVSGGQAQRIAIARALIAKPSILCLDEATSALDPLSGGAIDDMLQTLAGTRTIISITHRLSSVVKADKIVTLEKR